MPAIPKQWNIIYLETVNAKHIRLFQRQTDELVLFGCTKQQILCQRLLSLWVKKQANIHLLELLKKLSHDIQLPYHSASIRGQRSRWGSCSSKKTINLNYKLLFLPPHLVKHILIHELCHTVHLNHSAAFWNLVATLDCDWQKHNKDIKKANVYIPSWCI